MFDKELMLRTTGSLTQSESVGPVIVYGAPQEGLCMTVIVPDAYGANDTVLPKIYTSTNGTDYNLFQTYREGAVKTANGKRFTMPFKLPTGQKTWVKCELAVTVASTTGDFGTVTVGIVEGGGAEIDRSTHWS